MLNVLHFLVPLLVLNLALIVLGAYLVLHAMLRIRRYDRHIQELKRQHSVIAQFIE